MRAQQGGAEGKTGARRRKDELGRDGSGSLFPLATFAEQFSESPDSARTRVTSREVPGLVGALEESLEKGGASKDEDTRQIGLVTEYAPIFGSRESPRTWFKSSALP